MTRFDRFVMVDWSGGNDTGPKPRKDAIWACEAGQAARYFRNRALVEHWLNDLIEETLATGQRLCIGFDFPFGYPVGFAQALTGEGNPLRLWDWFQDRIEDTPQSNNRFDIAGEINQRFGGHGPFWGNGLKRDILGLPRTKASYTNPFSNRRIVETLAKGSFTCWQMSGVGSVGGQVMMGLPVLARLRHRWPGHIAVWPFEPLTTQVALVEIWPSLTVGQAPPKWIKDAWQVSRVANGLRGMDPDALLGKLDVSAPEEGWILGVRQSR